jgi:hypothetical protein
VTFAEFRDRRKIMDIEFHSRHQFKGETIPGMEPQQRFPDSRPNSFAGAGRGGNEGHSRGGNFGGGGRSGGFGASRGGFNDRNTSAPRDAGGGGYQNNGGGFGAQPEGRSYERKGGFNDRFAGARNDAPAPRGDFAARDGGAPRGDFGAPRADFGARKPAFGKPSFAKPGNGGKVFVPRDAKKWPGKADR